MLRSGSSPRPCIAGLTGPGVSLECFLELDVSSHRVSYDESAGVHKLESHWEASSWHVGL